MKKKVINVGGESLGIRFSKNECEIYKIKKGDILDLKNVFKELKGGQNE